MSRYDWPDVRSGKSHDNPGGRASFLARRRTDFDPDGALEAGRAAPAPHGAPAGPFAPPSGRKYLWQPLGPMTVLRGQATGKPRIAGRVNALAVDSSGTRVYAASGNGGIWYSSDGGAHWRSLGGFAPTEAAEVNRPAQRNSCGAIRVLFRATEADDDVYVGTGETSHLPNAQPGTSLGGIGILFAHGPAVSPNPDPWQRESKNLIGCGVNRFAVEPSGTTVVAATTIGLLQRPSPAAKDADWVRVAGEPFNTLKDECTDVLWTAGAGPRPARLWVWVRRGDKAGLWVRPQGTTEFKKIATGGDPAMRAVLAASSPPDQVFLLKDCGGGSPPPPPLLYRITAATASDPVANLVAGVPEILHGFGYYDIAIAVHPSVPNRVVLGGSTFSTTLPDGWLASGDGAVVLGEVAVKAGVLTFGHPNPYMMIGVGVHADVHDVVYSNNGDRLWVACDGGVYRSDKPVKPVSFYPCNDGLSIVESNYVASHPTCEGYVVTGLQDNGVIVRISNGIWHNAGLGDGGGVVFDPLRPDRFLRQHHKAYWSSSDGKVAAESLLTRASSFAKKEFKAAAFYSTAAAVAHKRGVPPPKKANVGQVIVGTDRVWYSENFGAPWPTGVVSWVTLPGGTDPLPGDLKKDKFGEAITVCRWQSPDVAWILGEGTLMRYARTPGSDNGGGPGTWTRETVLDKGVKNKKDATSAEGPIRESTVWTDIAVNLDPPTSADGPPTQHGTKGAVYLGTIGNVDDEDVDTLWWFDGTSKWYPTKLRKNGVPAPVTAIVCNPAFPAEVWVGTTVGVWRGVRTDHGADPPTWQWDKRVNGLPEAAVEDLAIFSDGDLVLLRAAIAARGMWELRLDVADVEDLTYVRAHEDDLRYRLRAVEKNRDQVTERSWHGSPDVRPRRASLSRPAPMTLPWTKSSGAVDTELLRRFQSALRACTGDPRVRPTGVWDTYFNEVLRDLSSPLMPSPPAPANTVCIDKTFWELSMTAPHATAEPWGAGIPLEADLYDFAAPLAEGDPDKASCSMPPQKLKVDVLVHRRGLEPIDGANVRVTLLWWTDLIKKNPAKWDNATKWFSGDVPWTAAVNEVLNSADGKTTKVIDGAWKFALGKSNQSHRITLAGQTLDPMRSGVATFDLDLTGVKKDRVVLLVAVIRAGATAADDIALVPMTLENLALTNSNVAVRSVRILP